MRIVSLVLAGCVLAAPALAAPGDVVLTEKTERYPIQVVSVAEGLEFPWSIMFLPDGNALVTEKPGRLRMLRGGALDPEPIAGLPEIRFNGDGGLLDVSIHPDFSENGFVYMCAVQGTEEKNGTVIIRGRLDGHALKDARIIFRAKNVYNNGSHFGCRLVWRRDGTLFATLGERYELKEEAQNLHNHLGTILRLNDDGSIPRDNPFVGKDGDDAIWSYGHRHVQGAALHPETGELWIHEHGPQGGDEVNISRAGLNYGWPIATYGIDYDNTIISEYTHRPGTEQPVMYWRPSIAPSGLTFYTGGVFPDWQGDIFVGALAGKHVERLDVEGERVMHRELMLSGLGERIRDVEEGPDGFLYVLTDSAEGRVLCIEPGAPAAQGSGEAAKP